MAAKKPIKKKQMRIKTTSGAVLIADYKGLPFTQLYKNWREACKDVTKEDMFMEVANVPTLLVAIQKHGVIARQRYNKESLVSPKNPNEGGVEIIRQLDAIAGKQNDLSKDQLPFLRKLVAELKSHTIAGSETNPRNIVFSDPVINDDGYIIDDETVYGHYRTVRYRLWRSNKKDKETGNFEDVPACPESWYDESLDTAEPPMWQALYAPTANNNPLKSKGLLPIMEEYLKAVENLTYSGTRENPPRITSRTIAKDIYEAFPKVREEVASWVKEGSPFLKTDLTLYGKQASESLRTIRIEASTAEHVDLFEEILKLQNIDVDSIYINVTPLQCTRMALMNKDYADRLKSRTYAQRTAVNRRAQSKAAKEEVERRRAGSQGKKSKKKK
tara:strand:+ start:1032 stop:2192 length:1161 start_codon:yes stop_codon:yes gene_type:complete